LAQNNRLELKEEEQLYARCLTGGGLVVLLLRPHVRVIIRVIGQDFELHIPSDAVMDTEKAALL